MRITPIILMFLYSTVLAQVKHVPLELIVKIQTPVRWSVAGGQDLTGIDGFDSIIQDMPGTVCRKAFQMQNSFGEAEKYIVVKLPEGADTERIRQKLEALPQTAYVCKNVVHSFEYIPSDSAYSEQYYLPQIKAPEAWDLISGAEEVLIGIIDTGVEYTHPDLQANIWLNPAEDKPPYGILDSSDYDGVDGDPATPETQNGYIDDLVGWDFVDTPELPFGTDFTGQDNDPMDSFGHGTAVAGIAGAVWDNQIGIAGAAPNAVIMPLRCGSSVYITELAVAQAIIYAIDPFPLNPSLRGVNIINMSFGSDEYSPLMEDVINYAASFGVLLVASAGNSGSSEPHYPSGYSEVISVGGVNELDQVSGFSNHGLSLSLVAPAQELISTVPDGGYDYFWGGTGTSFASPLVSAAGAVVWGMNPDLSMEEVKGIIINSADDIYQAGWDTLSGSGRLNMERALAIDEPLFAQIVYPAMGESVTGDSVLILGSVFGLQMQAYDLLWGIGNNPVEWNIIKQDMRNQIIDAELGAMVFDSTFADTVYSIRLTARDVYGFATISNVSFNYISIGAEISEAAFIPALDGDELSYLISFTTDQPCRITLRLSGANPQIDIEYTEYKTNHLYIVHENDLLPGFFNCQILAVNEVEMLTLSDTYINAVEITHDSFNASYYYFKYGQVLPDGHLLAEAYDFDGDGKAEVFLNDYTAAGYYDTLRHYEYENGVFLPSGNTYGITIPQDIGDSDADGKMEMMSRAFGNTYIFEQNTTGSVPNSVIFSDTVYSYGSKLLNLDPVFKPGEVFIRRDTVYQLYSHDSDEDFILEAVIDPEGMGPLGIPHSEWGDFNDDGNWEVVFGDGWGHLFVYTVSGNYSFSEVFRDSLPFNDTRDYLASGDFDGDGVTEFVAGCHAPVEYVESGTVQSYWQFLFYDNDGGEIYRADSVFFAGASDPSVFDAGVSTGDIDSDGKVEIFFSVYPNLYLVDYENGEYEVQWQYSPCRSNQVLIDDLDGNGIPEVTFNRGDGFTSFEAPGGNNLPIVPTNFNAFPLGPVSVKLQWNSVPNIQFYQISRSLHPDSLSDYIPMTPADTIFIDLNVETDTKYYYAVSSFAGGLYSPYSPIIEAIPNIPPQLLYRNFPIENPTTLKLEFSEQMSDNAGLTAGYNIAGIGHPSSAVLNGNRLEVLLTFDKSFDSNSSYTLFLSNIKDLQNTPISNIGPYNLTAPIYPVQTPYLMSGLITSNGNVILEFSGDMDADSASIVDRYSISFGESGVNTIDFAAPDTLNPQYVELFISQQTPIGALGEVYTISVDDLYSADGYLIDANHNQITLIGTARDLENVFVYPNPYRKDDDVDGENCVVFANLTDEASIRIFTLSGELVRKLESNLTFGGIKWYLDNADGRPAANGVYIYYVESDGKSNMGKIALMR